MEFRLCVWLDNFSRELRGLWCFELSSSFFQAKKFYESALRLEPGYLGAALALAELHVIEGRNGDAVSLLERYLKDWADDSLHVKLAQVYAATNMLHEALSHFQAALRLLFFLFFLFLPLRFCYIVESSMWTWIMLLSPWTACLHSECAHF